jgi:hypothetical protein
MKIVSSKIRRIFNAHVYTPPSQKRPKEKEWTHFPGLVSPHSTNVPEKGLFCVPLALKTYNMQNLRFMINDEVRRIGSNTKLTVKAIVNDPDGKPVSGRDKETGPEKVYSCSSNNVNRKGLFKDEELELWPEKD